MMTSAEAKDEMEMEMTRRAARKKDLLKSYYTDSPGGSTPSGQDGPPPGGPSPGGGPVTDTGNDLSQPVRCPVQGSGAGTGVERYDIDGAGFSADSYLVRLLHQKSLTELMEKEEDITRSIRSLDSSMQTLVYENYNKFIGATDTIRKMKNDFKQMETKMDSLASNMENITEFSGQISETLQNRRQGIHKLYNVHGLLKKLQFLFELPSYLQRSLEKGHYEVAVRSYVKAKAVLDRYRDKPSFKGIHEDCRVIVKDLKTCLKRTFADSECDTKRLSQCVGLLLELDEPPQTLFKEYLSHGREKLSADLQELEWQIQLKTTSVKPMNSVDDQGDPVAPAGIEEFVQTSCNQFIGNMSLVIGTYADMFLINMRGEDDSDTMALKMLINFVNELMERYFCLIGQRLTLEVESPLCEPKALVKALDKFHTKLKTMNQLLTNTDFASAGNDVVMKCAHNFTDMRLQHLKSTVNERLISLKESCSSSTLLAQAAPTSSSSKGRKLPLLEMLDNLNLFFANSYKVLLTDLKVFLDPSRTFAVKAYFRESFCRYVKQKVVTDYLQHISSLCMEFVDTQGSGSPTILMILAKFCLVMSNSTVPYLVAAVNEKFPEGSKDTHNASQLASEFKELSVKLLNHYVKAQGAVTSQLLRKSVETRDWLRTTEPRTVRPVMKRVVEDVTAADSLVGQLFEEGDGGRVGSDSSRRTFNLSSASRQQPGKANWTYASSVNSSLMSNIQKLFTEKIDVFSAIEFTKSSILTGIIKISLKTFMECVRLRTFNHYGLQQIQVDTHYLQLYLWRFVSDESVVQTLLDEIVGSAVHRCFDPVLMEPTVVELICEQG